MTVNLEMAPFFGASSTREAGEEAPLYTAIIMLPIENQSSVMPRELHKRQI